MSFKYPLCLTSGSVSSPPRADGEPGGGRCTESFALCARTEPRWEGGCQSIAFADGDTRAEGQRTQIKPPATDASRDSIVQVDALKTR